MLQHEFFRPKNANFLSDVYDSPAWKEFMGSCVYPNGRIGLQFCVDGIPAFSANTLSLKPAEFVILSLPPAVRHRIENILLLMLLPSTMKNDQAKKYYDFAATFELNDLFDNGKWSFFFYYYFVCLRVTITYVLNCVSGVNGVKVKVFSTSMDTPGRSELLGMESSASYTGCPVCTHCWSRNKVYDGYRRFLQAGSSGRQTRVHFQGRTFEYGRTCTRPKPQYRKTDFVRLYLVIVRSLAAFSVINKW